MPRVLLLVGIMIGAAIYCEDYAPKADRAFIQALIWTFSVFTLVFIDLLGTLRRPRQALIGILLLVTHFFGIDVIWYAFPFRSFFSIIIGVLVEAVVVGLFYIRLGQSIDPDGPFGPTTAENKTSKHRYRI